MTVSKRFTAPPPIGQRLRSLRAARHLTLEQVARRSGLSKSVLSQIERGKVNPTFATLWNLTQSLNIDISELLEEVTSGAESAKSIEHLTTYSTPSLSSVDGRCTVRILSPRRANLPVEWYEMVFEPGGELYANPHGNRAWEHLTVVEGRLVVVVGDEEFELHRGETIRYDADQPHGARNPSDEGARAFLVLVLKDSLGLE